MTRFAFLCLCTTAFFLTGCPGNDDYTVVEETGGTVPEETDEPLPAEGTTDPYAPANTGRTNNTGTDRPWKPPSNDTSASNTKYPKGLTAEGKKGFARSPFAPYAGLVDVSGIASGTPVRCPYTGGIFTVP